MEKPAIPNFSRNQLHVMQILWDSEGPLKPAEIEDRFRWPIENATLRSILRVLLDQGEVERKKLGRAFVYSSKKKKGRALSELVSGLAEVFSSGSKTGLVAQLIQEDSLSKEEVEQLQELIGKQQKKGANS